jgi:hypothetical protein
MTSRSLFFAWFVCLCGVAAAADSSQIPKTKLDMPVSVYLSPGDTEATECYTDNPAFLQRVAAGRVWSWQSPKEYHKSAVVVRTPSGAGGSGTVVSVSSGQCLVITCDHVVEGTREASITFQDGTKVAGNVIVRWTHYDVAAIHVPNPPSGFTSVPISKADPPAGSQIEVMGYGGPRFGQFRPYVASRTVGGMAPISIDAPSISGDSGGGMIWDGSLVGVQFGAYVAAESLPQIQGVRLVYPASSKATPESLSQFTQRACELLGGGCQPIFGRPGSQQPQQPLPQDPFYPPAGWQSQPPAPVNDDPPGCKCQGCCEKSNDGVSSDLNKKIADLEKKISEMPAAGGIPVIPVQPVDMESMAAQVAEIIAKDERLRGPAGKDGAAGKDGKNAEVSSEQLAAIANAVAAGLKSDPSVRGEPGPPGPKGDPGKDGKDGKDGAASSPISDIKVDGDGYVYVTYGNGRREQVGRITIPKQSDVGVGSPAYFKIVPK